MSSVLELLSLVERLRSEYVYPDDDIYAAQDCIDHANGQRKGAADRIEALEAVQRRTEDHMRAFADISPLDRTDETEAIIYRNAKLLQGE